MELENIHGGSEWILHSRLRIHLGPRIPSTMENLQD
jgi:hypothetical protein